MIVFCMAYAFLTGSIAAATALSVGADPFVATVLYSLGGSAGYLYAALITSFSPPPSRRTRKPDGNLRWVHPS